MNNVHTYRTHARRTHVLQWGSVLILLAACAPGLPSSPAGLRQMASDIEQQNAVATAQAQADVQRTQQAQAAGTAQAGQATLQAATVAALDATQTVTAATATQQWHDTTRANQMADAGLAGIVAAMILTLLSVAGFAAQIVYDALLARAEYQQVRQALHGAVMFDVNNQQETEKP